MADRKITDFLTLATLKTNTIFTIVDPDEAAPVDQNKKITVFSMFSTFEPTFSKNTAFNKNFAGTGAATTVARSDHVHTGVYEPVFSKNTAFNKDFGTGAGQVSEGDHNHSGIYEPVFSKNTAFNKDFAGTGATTVSRSDHNHSGVYEPVFSKNTAFNKDFGTGSGEVSEGDHTHSGVYEPVFSKNTAFNKNFAGSGAATTVARSDHTHQSSNLTDVSYSTRVAGDIMYYNGSLWTNLPNAQAKNTYSYWNNGGSGNNIYYTAGTVTINNTLILSSVAADTGFSTSTLLSLDSAGNVNKIAASAGGTTNFLRADGSWAAPPGGGGGGDVYVSGTPVNNQIAIWTDAITIEGDSNITFSAGLLNITGNLTVSSSVSTDTLKLLNLSADAGFATSKILTLDGSDNVDTLPVSGGGTTNFLRADGTWAAPPGGAGGGIVDGGSSTQNGATYTVDCDSNQQYMETIITDDTTSTWTISNLDFEVLLFVENVDPADKTLTLSATGMVFINMDAKVAKTAATTTLALTVPGGVNYTHEISIVDSGLTDGGDRVLHVKQG